MSASILWRLVADNPPHIGTYAPSAFMASMEKADMGLPCTLGNNHLERLRGMAALFSDKEGVPNPYQEIVEIIEKHGDIELWAEH